MDQYKIKSDFTALSDEELAREIKEGNKSAFDEISKRYRGLISSIARRYSAAGFEHSDFMQEGLIALLSACKAYKSDDKKAAFKNFAAVCISNRFFSVIRSTNTKGAIPSDQLVPIEGIEISDQNKSNPETLIMEQESSRDLQNIIKNKLSQLEQNVLKFYLNGYSYQEIANKLSVSPKSVDNALVRIRRKIAEQK
ncbi:MAG: sigma-70 family RNA polymerase sigma factor [Ruminococcus sp.]|nr:sigma-70 family RNA polymerase sigma factor [Ruminococcus sp.]